LAGHPTGTSPCRRRSAPRPADGDAWHLRTEPRASPLDLAKTADTAWGLTFAMFFEMITIDLHSRTVWCQLDTGLKYHNISSARSGSQNRAVLDETAAASGMRTPGSLSQRSGSLWLNENTHRGAKTQPRNHGRSRAGPRVRILLPPAEGPPRTDVCRQSPLQAGDLHSLLLAGLPAHAL
jgi:hypothetical protein